MARSIADIGREGLRASPRHGDAGGHLVRARAPAITDAEQVARSITSPDQQAQALPASRGAQARDLDRAERIARSITDPGQQAHGRLATVAAAAGLAGRLRPRRADRPVHHRPGPAGTGPGRGGAAARPRRRHRAERIARSITDPGQQARALAVAGHGGRPGAGELDGRRRADRPVHHRPDQQARALAGAWRRASATTTAREAATTPSRSPGPSPTRTCRRRPWPRRGRRPRRANSTGGAGAEPTAARSITDPDQQARALAGVAGTAAGAGDRPAEQVARSITNPHQQARALAGATVRRRGRRPRPGRALADRRRAVARSITDPDQQARALAGVAKVAAGGRRHRRARALAADAEPVARSITDPYQQAQSLTDLAEAAPQRAMPTGQNSWRPMPSRSSVHHRPVPAGTVPGRPDQRSARSGRHGSMVRSIKGSTSDSNLARVIFIDRCFGPDWSAVMYGRLISVCCELDSSIFAFSAASLRRCSASTSFLRVDARFLLVLGDDVVDEALVEVLAAQEGVAVGGQHFELVLAVDVGDLDHRHVERAAAQVVHRDLAVPSLLQAERERACGGLVDDALDVEARDAPASRVACRCESPKSAGTVMTASVTFPRQGNPRRSSSSCAGSSAETCCGEIFLAADASTHALSPLSALTMANGESCFAPSAPRLPRTCVR